MFSLNVLKELDDNMSLLNIRRLKYSTKNYGPFKRHIVLCWASFLQFLRHIGRKFSVVKIALTILAFAVFVLILPLFLISFVVLGIYRKILQFWISWSENWELDVADVTFRTAMETREQAAVMTIAFTLDGVLEEGVIEKWLNEFLEKKNPGGNLVHLNFQRQLVNIKGFFAWKKDSEFRLENHVINTPSHHHGRTLTERNIQEYISEMCSEPLPQNHSPWQVNVAAGVSEVGNPVTWVVFRVHHLLATALDVPNLPFSLPNPWESVSPTRRFALLEAPSVTRNFVVLIAKGVFRFIVRVFYIFILFVKNAKAVFNRPDYLKYLKESVTLFLQKCLAYLKDVLSKEKWFQLLLKHSFKISYNYLSKTIFFFISQIHFILVYLKNVLFSLPPLVPEIISGKNNTLNLLKDVSLEMYWVIRAMFSLPRLLMEEIFATRSTVPLNIWRRKGSRMWNRTMVSWSEEVPLMGAIGIQGATGASLSSVLITALSGGIRDLLRYSGAQTPEHLRCTLPVYIPHTSPNQGLVSFPLPTGCSYGQKALREVCRYLDRMRKYPETYLASVWSVKHISKFLPEIILKRVLKFLTTSHPVLLINLVGPSSLTYLWGLELKSLFYWRPPQNDAVISVCISSYCGRVSLGVLADGWAVPHAHTLPQSFASHLNELAVESGVKLERTNSKTWSRTSSPRSTPSPTPPPTPTINRWVPFSEFSDAFKNRLRRRLNQASYDAKMQQKNDLNECLEENEQCSN